MPNAIKGAATIASMTNANHVSEPKKNNKKGIKGM